MKSTKALFAAVTFAATSFACHASVTPESAAYCVPVLANATNVTGDANLKKIGVAYMGVVKNSGMPEARAAMIMNSGKQLVSNPGQSDIMFATLKRCVADAKAAGLVN